MDTPPPPAVELHRIDAALHRLEGERARLLALRAEVLARLDAPAPPTVPEPAATGPAGRHETDPSSVQNVLLALGGVLLAVALSAFTVLSWGLLGIGGRAAVLAGLTLAVLGAPPVLLRRSLAATAEVVACLGLLLLVLDAFALHRVALPAVDGSGYAAAVCAVLAGGWAGYGRWTAGRAGTGAPEADATALREAGAAPAPRGLRLPPVRSLLLAQAPLPLCAAATGAGIVGHAAALLATAAFDAAVTDWELRRGFERL